MRRFLTTLLVCLMAYFFFIGAQAGASLSEATIGQKVDFRANIVEGQVIEGVLAGSAFKSVVSSCVNEGNEVRVGKGDNGKQITIKIGDVLQIELERSGGTGYEWYLDQSYKRYFELLREETVTRRTENLVGTPVVRRWKLRAIEGGEAGIRLFLYREWEGIDKAVETFRIEVRILQLH